MHAASWHTRCGRCCPRSAVRPTPHAPRPTPHAQFCDNDEDKDGSLNYEEFKQALEIIAPSFSEAELKGAFRSADRDGSGTVDKNEFLKRVPQFQQMSEDMASGNTPEGRAEAEVAEKNLMALTEEERKEAEALFKKYDKDQSGELDFGEFRKVRNAALALAQAKDGAEGVCVRVRPSLRGAWSSPKGRWEGANGESSPSQVMKVIAGDGLSDSSMLKAFEFCDKDGTGNIDYREFLASQSELKKWKQKKKPNKKK